MNIRMKKALILTTTGIILISSIFNIGATSKKIEELKKVPVVSSSNESFFAQGVSNVEDFQYLVQPVEDDSDILLLDTDKIKAILEANENNFVALPEASTTEKETSKEVESTTAKETTTEVETTTAEETTTVEETTTAEETTTVEETAEETAQEYIYDDNYNAQSLDEYINYLINEYSGYDTRIELTYDNLLILTKLVTGEAQDEPFDGKIAVAEVVLNRSYDKGQTLEEIIYSPHQFSCVNDGNFYKPSTTNDALAALNAILGVCPSDGSLYFDDPRYCTSWASKNRTKSVKIGNHQFYY